MGIRCKIATAPIRRLAEQLNLNPIITTHYVSLWQESTNNTDSTLPQIEQLKGFIEKLDRKESYNKLNTPTFEKVKGNKGLSYNQNGVIMIEDYDDISNFYKEFSNRNDVIEYFDRLANNIEESQKFLAHLESLREQYAGEKSDNEIVTEALDLMKEIHSMTNPELSSSRLQKIAVKSLGEVFTKIGDNFYDSQWNKVTDSSLINKLSEANKGQDLGEFRDTITPAVRREMEEIKAKSIANGTFMKAPNGKPTNLNKEQWLIVRTKTFKNWFGDWERSYDIIHSKGRSGLFRDMENKALAKINPDFPVFNNAIINLALKLGRVPMQNEVNTADLLKEAGLTKYIKTVNFADDTVGEDVQFDLSEDYAEAQMDLVKLKEKHPNLNLRFNSYNELNRQGEKFIEDFKKQDLSQSIYDDLNAVNSVSKVVDENGEPLVVYHRTNDGKFNIFDPLKSDDKISLFASDNRAVSESYTDELDEYIPKRDEFDTIVRLSFLPRLVTVKINGNKLEGDYNQREKEIKENDLITIEVDEDKTYSYTYKKNDSQILDDFFSKASFKKYAYTFSLFYSLKNPLIIDGNGHYWSEIIFEGSRKNTRELAKIAKERGYDGVIYKNIIDISTSNHISSFFEDDIIDDNGDIIVKGYYGESNIFNAFSSNQIKSATDNAGTFSPENEDIYYQKSYSAGRKLAVNVKSGKLVHGRLTGVSDDFIGTGEGAQAYGYGHYSTSIYDIAKSYASQRATETGEAVIHTFEMPDNNGENYLVWEQKVPDVIKNKISEKLPDFNTGDSSSTGASLYFDLCKYFNKENNYNESDYTYNSLSAKAASEFLNSIGVIGSIHHSDTSHPNYVIFTEKNIKVTDWKAYSMKNGKLEEEKRNAIKTIKEFIKDFLTKYNFSKSDFDSYSSRGQKQFSPSKMPFWDAVSRLLKDKDINDKYLEDFLRPLNKELNQKLEDILKDYGFEFRHVKSLEGNALGKINLINKIIMLANGENRITMPEEFSHAFIELMGGRFHTNMKKFPETKIFTELMKDVESTDIFERVYDEYKDIYIYNNGKPNINKIKKEAIGQALAAAISREAEGVGENTSFVQKVWNWFKSIAQKITAMFSKDARFELLLKDMANSIMQGRYKEQYLDKVDRKDYQLQDFRETIDNHIKKHGTDVIPLMSVIDKSGAILSGSLALRAQGTIYRKKQDSLHDLDYIVPEDAHLFNSNHPGFKQVFFGHKDAILSSEQYVSMCNNLSYFQKLKNSLPGRIELISAFPSYQNRSLTVRGMYSTDTAIMDKIVNTEGTFDQKLKALTKEEQDKVYNIDFFLYSDSSFNLPSTKQASYNDNLAIHTYPTELPGASSIKLIDFRIPMEAKLVMGRAKDIDDYQYFTPVRLPGDYVDTGIGSSNYTYYQNKVTPNTQPSSQDDNLSEIDRLYEDNYVGFTGEGGYIPFAPGVRIKFPDGLGGHSFEIMQFTADGDIRGKHYYNNNKYSHIEDRSLGEFEGINHLKIYAPDGTDITNYNPQDIAIKVEKQNHVEENQIITNKQALDSTPIEVTYNLPGQKQQTYTIKGTHIYNKKGEEVYQADKPHLKTHRNRIFANLAVQQGEAVLVNYKDSKYVVNNRGEIMSVSGKNPGHIMGWVENDGNRKAILALAQEEFAKKAASAPAITLEDYSNDIVNQIITHFKEKGISLHGREELIKYLEKNGYENIQQITQAFIGKKARTQFEQQLIKARPDLAIPGYIVNGIDFEKSIFSNDIVPTKTLSAAEAAPLLKEGIITKGIFTEYALTEKGIELGNKTYPRINEILDFLHSLEDNKENTAYIKTAIRWIANRSLTLPQDHTKAYQAFELARKKNLDLQKYKTLGELITSPEMQPKKRGKKDFNPDKATTFSNKRTVTTEGGRVFTVYDVENTEEGQREVCKALAAHYEMSPWCLSTFTATGEPTASAKNYWQHYSALPRKIAYENGKPVAFNSGTKSDLQYSLNGLKAVYTPNREYNGSKYELELPKLELKDLDKNTQKIVKNLLEEGIIKNIYEGQEADYYPTYSINKEYIDRIDKSTEAWWDMEDRHPQSSLSDSIVSDGKTSSIMMQIRNIFPDLPDNIHTIAEADAWARETHPEDFYNLLHPELRTFEAVAEINSFEAIAEIAAEGLGLLGSPEEINTLVEMQRQGILLTDDNYRNFRREQEEGYRHNREENGAALLAQYEQDLADGIELAFFLTPQGEVYGFVDENGDIYIDETVIRPEHLIHEFTHLWDRALAHNNQELWEKGVKLMKQLDLWKQIEDSDEYSEYGRKWKAEGKSEKQMEFLIASEVHSRIVGEEGEKLLNKIAKEQNGSEEIIEKLKRWILEAWKDLKSTFGEWTDEDMKIFDGDVDTAIKYFNRLTIRDFALGINPNTISRQQTAQTNSITTKQALEQANGFIGEVNRSPYIKVGNKFVLRKDTSTTKILGIITDRGHTPETWSYGEPYDGQTSYNVGYESGSNSVISLTNRDLFDENWSPSSIIIKREDERLNETLDTQTKYQISQFPEATFLVENNDLEVIKYLQEKGYSFKLFSDTGQDNNLPTQQQPSLTGQTKEKPKEQIVKLEDGSREFLVKGDKIYENGREVFTSGSLSDIVNRNKVFANQAVKNGDAIVIGDDEFGKVVSYKDGTFFSVATGQKINATDRLKANAKIAWEKKLGSNNNTLVTPKTSIPQNRISGKNQYGFTQTAKKEITDKLGENVTSIDMVEAGYRTRTTRSASEAQKYNLSVGDIFEQYGVSKDGTTKKVLTRVTAIYGQDDPRFLGNWNKEGWTDEGIEDIKRFKEGAKTIEFELVTDTINNQNNHLVEENEDKTEMAADKIQLGENLDRKTAVSTVQSMQDNSNPEFNEADNKVKKLLGGKPLKVVMASEHSDPTNHAKKVCKLINDDLKNPPEQRKYHMLQIMTKHDGLPLLDMLELKIPKAVHFSITSLGGTNYEPRVMKPDDLLDRIEDFIKQGKLNPATTTIRIDPIIPGVTTREGIEHIVERAKDMGIRQFKMSVLDSYGYDEYSLARNVMSNMREKNNYDFDKYYNKYIAKEDINGRYFKQIKGKTYYSQDAKPEVMKEIYEMVNSIAEKYNVRFATCGEKPAFGNYGKISFAQGCLSAKGVADVLGTSEKAIKENSEEGKQRPGKCHCLNGKFDALAYDDTCFSGCTFCYAKQDSASAFKYYNEDGTLKDNVFTRTRRPAETKESTNQQQPSYESTISKVGYRKGDPQAHKDTAYIFTENAQANATALGLDDSWIEEGYNKGDKVKLYVSDMNGENQAGIRAVKVKGKDQITPNAFGIVVKKYQQKESSVRFLQSEGQFKDTDADFELFKTANIDMFKRLEESNLKKIMWPYKIGLGKAALPQRFAEWLQEELNMRFGVVSEVQKNNKAGYYGYGLQLTSIEGTNQQQSTGEAKVKPVIDTKGDTAQKIQPSTFTFSDGITVNTPFEVNDQQAAALDELDKFVKGDGIAITLSGYAGTGKTSIMQIFADKMRKSNKWIEFTASTNKAAAVLKSKVEPQGFTAKTLHKFFGIIVEVAGDEYDEENLTNVENFKVQEDITIGAIVVIDEASMINEENFKILTDVAKKKNLKLIFLGDEAQLAPVGETQKSIVFRNNSISNKVITLTKVERTGDNAILAEATALRNSQPLSKVSSFNDKGQGVAYVKTNNEEKINQIINHFIKGLKNNSDFFRVLARTNKTVAAYNQLIRRVLGYAGKEPQVNEPMMGYANWGYIYQTKTYQFINSESYKVVKTSEPHKIRYGQYELEATPIELEDSMGVVHTFNYIDIKNNQNNRIVATELARQKDILWKEAKKTFGSKKRALQQQISDIEQFLFVNDKILNPVNGKKLQSKVIDFGYAMTTHKSQGSTFTHVLVDENDISNAKNSTNELPPALKYASESVRQEWIAKYGGTVNTNPNDIKNLSQQLKYVAVSRATDTVTIISDNVISEGDPINPVSNSTKNEQAAEEIQDFSEDVSPNEDLTNELLSRITGAKINVIKESEEEFEKTLDKIKAEVKRAKTYLEFMVTGEKGEFRDTILPEVRQEMDEIKAKAIADGTFMKAPNGKDSNLNEEQWLLVRTKTFKNWFGDWEKLAPKSDATERLVSVLNNIANSNTKYSALAKLILDNNALPYNLKYFKIDNTRDDVEGHAGQWHSLVNLIEILANDVSQEELNKALLHELIHYNTEKLLQDYRQNPDSVPESIRENIRDLYDIISYAKDFITENFDKNKFQKIKERQNKNIGSRIFYAFDNQGDIEIDEFISEIFTNPGLQEVLNEIQYKETKKTLWDRIKEAIQSIFGININKGSVLEEALKASTEFITKAKKDYDSASKVVDENGEPLVVYHGGEDNIRIFKSGGNKTAVISFDSTHNLNWAKKEGYEITPEIEERYNNGEEVEVARPVGMYFSTDKTTSKSYLGKTPSANTLYPVFLNIKNPYKRRGDGEQLYSDADTVTDLKEARKKGNDGVIISNVKDYGGNDAARIVNGEFEDKTQSTIIVNSSTQIKSATDNNGMFSASDHIEYAKDSNEVVYGFHYNGKLYVNEDKINPGTLLHEYTHLWLAAVKNRNSELYESIKNIFRNDKYAQEFAKKVLSEDAYKDLANNEEALMSEVISRISSKKNRKKLEEWRKGNEGLFDNLLNKIGEFWKWIGKNLFDMKEVHSMEEVTDRILYDLLSKTDLQNKNITLYSGTNSDVSVVPAETDKEKTDINPVNIVQYPTIDTSNQSPMTKLSALITPVQRRAREQWIAAMWESAVNDLVEERINTINNEIEELEHKKRTSEENLRLVLNREKVEILERNSVFDVSQIGSEERRNLIDEIGIDTIINKIKEYILNKSKGYTNENKEKTEYIRTQSKIVYDYFNLLFESAVPIIEQREQIKLDIKPISSKDGKGVSGKVKNEKKEKKDTQDTETGTDIGGNMSVKIRMIDPHLGASKITRAILSSLKNQYYKLENGSFVVKDVEDDMDHTSYINPEDAHYIILNAFQDVIISDDFAYKDKEGNYVFPLFEHLKTKYPWVQSLIYELGNNSQYISTFYSDMRMDFIQYVEMKTNTTYALDEQTSYSSIMLDVYKHQDEKSGLVENHIFSNDFKKDEANTLIQNIYDAIATNDEEGDSDKIKFTEEWAKSNAKNFQILLQTIGIDIAESDVKYFLANKTMKDIYIVVDMADKIIKSLGKGKDINGLEVKVTSDNVASRNTPRYRDIANALGECVPPNLQKSFIDGEGNTRYSFSVPSYVSKMVNLLNNPQKNKEIIENQYKRYKWFYRQPDEEKGINGRWHWAFGYWIENGEKLNLSISEMLNIDGKPYKDWNSRDIRKATLIQYHEKALVKGQMPKHKFLLPIFADSPVAMFVEFGHLEIGTEYRRDKASSYTTSLGILCHVLEQEIDRILELKKRNKVINEKIGSRISNYDKTDEKDLEKFRFFPELNGTDFYKKAQEYKYKIQIGEIPESEYSKYEDFLADTVRNLMETKIEREANLYEKEFSKDDDIMDWVLNKEGISQSFKEFIYAHSAINTQMIEMLQVDPAYTKDAIDFQKRWKAVYTSGKKPFTNSDYGRKTERTIFLSDRNMTSTSYQNIQNILNQAIKDGRIEEMDKDIILTKFRNINQADAQAYRCLPSFRAVLDMYGLWNDKDQQTYDRFEKKTFTVEDFNTIWQTIKPVVYSQISKPSPVEDDEIKDEIKDKIKDEIKVPHYHKNSEFLLLALYDFMSGRNMDSSDKLRALQTFMEEKFDEDGNGIDVAQFESAVKIGGQAPIDITFSPKKLAKIIGKNSDEITSADYDEYKKKLDEKLNNGEITSDEYNSSIEAVDLDYDETLEILKSSAYQKDGTFNPNVVHEIDYEDYAMQQPPHESLVDEEVVFGSQLRNLVFADIPEDAIFIIDDKEYKRDDLRRLYSNIIIENLLQDYKNVLGEFVDKYGNISYEKLSDFLISKAKDDNKLSPESIDAFKIITDSKGKKSFNLPLNNPQLVERIEQYIATAFKNGVTRQKIKGGACVLVSDFGLSDKLKIEYGVDENGNQFVKSIPCYMPANAKKYFEKFTDKNGELRIEDVPEELLEAVGYRIPTEDKYSMAPLKIVGFLPQQNGSCIMLPADIVTMAGSDFDIDKMFLMLPSFEEVDDKLQYVKYDTDPKLSPKEQSREARDNMLIKIVRSILTSPYSAHILMSSGNFDRVKVAGRISKIMSDDTLLGKYIENMNLSQQENESDDNYHNRLTTHFEGALKNYSEDDIKKLNDFIKENEVERSVFDISTFIYNHRQNMTGGKLIGIYANGSNICAKYQYSGLRLKEDYQFTYNGKVIDSVSSSLDMENKRIIKSLAEFLAASVDGVKDPVLADIMQMENTANIAVFMIRAGFTISDVAALFSNPIVRSYIIENEKLRGFSGKVYKSYIDAFSEELYGNIPSKKDFLKKAIGTGLSTTSIIKTNIALKLGQNIARNFKELSVKGVNESRKNNEEVFRTLAFVGYIADLADQFNEITMATRADSPKNSAEITFGGIRTQIQAITLINEKAKTDDWFFDNAIGAMPQNLLDKGNFTNISKLREILTGNNFRIPITQAFHTLGIEGAYQISNAILGLDNEKMSKLVDSFLIDMPNGNTSPDVMRIFYKDLTTFSLGESREFSAVPNSDKVNSENYEYNRFWYLYSLPHELIEKKRDNVIVDVNGTKSMSDFLVLQNLKVRDGVISIRTPKGLGKNTRDAYMRDLDMLFMGGGYGAELVIKLVRYSYFHEGLNFGMSGLSQLFSPFIMSKFNEINNSLNKIKDITNDNTKSERFLDQFYFNNPELPRKIISYKGKMSIKEIMKNGYKPSKDNKQVINKNKSKKNGTYGIITEMYKYINLVTENGTIRMKYERGKDGKWKYVYHPVITDFDIVDGKIATKKYNPFLSVEELAKTSFTEEERKQVNKTLALYPSEYKDPLDSLDSNDNFNYDDPGVDIDSLDFQIISKDKASDGEDYSEIISKDKASDGEDYSEEEGQACLSKPLC